MRASKTLVYLFVVMSLWLPVSAEVQTPAEMQQKFKEALKTVDRLVLLCSKNEIPNPKAKNQGPILLELTGTEVIASLGETIKIGGVERWALYEQQATMIFYSGENYRFSLTVSFGYRLSGEDLGWDGSAELTESSAAKLRTWFAEHGYDGFVKRHAGMMKAGEEYDREWQHFRELFPEPVRESFPSESEFRAVQFARSDDFREKKYREPEYSEILKDLPPPPEIYLAEKRELKAKREQWLAQYTDRSKLILDCWRGIGTYDPKGVNPGNPVPQFLGFLVDMATPEEIGIALEHLPVDEDAVWVGAYMYYWELGELSKERKTQVLSADWLARLVRRVMPGLIEHQQRWTIYELVERPMASTNAVLLEVAGTGPLSVSTLDEEGHKRWFPEPSNALQALLGLAKNRTEDVRSVIRGRMAEVSDPETRLALEVAEAQFVGPARIDLKHIQSTITEVSDMAWDAFGMDQINNLSLENLMVLAKKAGSSRVQKVAEGKLEARGLRLMTAKEKAEMILSEPHFSRANSIEQIDQDIASYRPASDTDEADYVVSALKHRKGRLLVQEGRYGQAIALLLGRLDRRMDADRAFALQTLGRFSDASSAISSSVADEDQEAISKQQERFGYLGFAQGQFGDAVENFTSANSIGHTYLKDGQLTLMRYLSQLLAGKEATIPTIDMADLAFPGEAMTEAKLDWPESGILFLGEKMSKSEVLKRIEKRIWKKEDDLCEAHFVFAALCRAKGDLVDENKHLQAALATKAFTNQCYSLATLRMREVEAIMSPKR